jgi:hypothetical protein
MKPKLLFLLIALLLSGCSGQNLFEPTQMAIPLPSLTSTTIPTKTPVPTSTPERIQLMSGEPDACALFTESEIESALGLKTIEATISLEGATACRYVTMTSEPQEVLFIIIYTDQTWRKAGKSYTATSWFDLEKEVNLKYIGSLSEQEIQDVSNLGDKAYYKVGSLIDLYILNNNIEYVLDTRSPEAGGSGSVDKLISLGRLAISRIP